MPIKKRRPIALILSLAISAGLTLSAGAQTVDQAALAQALAASQGGGTSPTVAPALPTVNTLSSPVATAPAATMADLNTLSPIERMFSGMAAAVGGPAQDLSQFGYALFEKPTAPSLAAIGDDYVLGPGDGLVLYLWGDPVDIKEISASYALTVDRNGFIFLPPAGQVAVWGQDLGTVRTVIKEMLARKFKKLEMSLTLSSLRQFPIFVTGYAGSPGTVLATGADTVLSIISRAGGILKTGSLRKVVLSRNGKNGAETKPIDFYDTLINGAAIDLRVREGDSIHIPGIGPVAALAGELKRPGIYELSGETSIAQTLALAGGALPSVRSSGITLLRFSESGRILSSGDLSNAGFASTKATDGDFIFFGKVADLLVGQTQVSGPVKYAGRYEISSYKSLKALLSKAQLLPETNLFYGRVYRMDPSGRDKSFSFSPREVLAGADLPLAEFDRVVLYRYDDTAVDPDFDHFPNTLVVSGPVKYPGFYLYKEGATLAGLLADNALTLDASRWYAEIIAKTESGQDKYFTFSPEEILSGAKDIQLSRLDRIRFVKRGAEVAAHDFDKFSDAVLLSGQVAKPDVYALKVGLKLSQVLTKDQILLDTNLNYAEILRLKADGKNEYVTFRPSEVLEGKWDFDLGARDVIRLVKVGYAPAAPDFDRFANAVQLNGPVQFAGLYAWREGMKLSSLLTLAKPSLQTNQVYAEIVRPLGGSKFEYLTFAPREIASGAFDLALKARDAVKLYTTVPVATTKQGAEATTTEPAPAVMAASGAVAPAPIAVPAAPAEAGGLAATATPVAPVATTTAAPAASMATTALLATPLAPLTSGDAAPTDLDRFLEIVTVSGSVRYAGPYARTPTLKLSSVITADQMLEETNLDYAELTRLKDDGSYEYATFAPKDVLERKYDLTLRARDSIRLVKKTVFGGTLAAANIEKFSDLVQLTGQVARPEIFALKPSMKLSQVLTKDQILLDTNLNYAEILRLKTDGKNDYVTFRPSELLEGKWDFDLGARDVIRLVKVGYAPAAPDFDRFANAVQLSGPVQFAGLYAWRDGMKLSSLLSLAKPSLQTNQVYAEIVRPLGGSKFEYLTFAPREIASGAFDLALKARDAVKLYTTVPVATTKQGAEATTTEPTPAAMAATGAASPAQIAVPAAPAEAGGTPATATPMAPVATTTVAPPATSLATSPASSTSGEAAPTDLGRFLEIVTVSGSVRYAGPYARTPSLKLSSVITADQILEETNLDYAELTRLKDDGRYEYATFAPKDVLEGKYDLTLRARDSIRLVKKTIFGGTLAAANVEKFSDLVQLTGQVARPEIFALKPDMKLSQVLTKDQILLDTNLNYAEILRLKADGKNDYVTFRPSELLEGKWDFDLGARDVIRLVKVGYAPAAPDFDRFANAVQLSGPVQFAGLYAWRDGMKLSSLLTLAKPSLQTNQVYAEIVRPLGGNKFEYLTFAPREIAAGAFDLALKARDAVKLYTTVPVATTKQGAEATTTEPTPAAMAASGAVAPAPIAVPAAPAEAGGTPATATPMAPVATTTVAPPATSLATSPASSTSGEAAPTDLGRFLEIVTVSGSVRYAGPYARTPTLKLSSVITADQMLEETNLDYAELTRLKDDGSYEYATFAPKDVLERKYDLTLRARDSIRLVKKTVFGGTLAAANVEKFSDLVQLTGQVARPEIFALKPDMKLSQVLTKDQVLLETNLDYAELTRLKDDGSYEYATFAPKDVLEGKYDLALRARDSIRLVKKTIFGGTLAAVNVEKFSNLVQLTGQVARPEIYALKPDMKLSQVLTKDQILLDTNLNYAEILRLKADGKNDYVTFRPSEVLEGEWDFDLGARDVIRLVKVGYAPAAPDFDRFANAVQLSGPVQFSGLYAWREGMKLSSLLTLAKPSLQTNQVYAEIVRPLGGSKFEYLTFAPREIASGAFDLALKARDAVKLYTTVPVATTKQGAETTTTEPAPAATAAPGAATPAPIAVPAAPAEAGGTAATATAMAPVATTTAAPTASMAATAPVAAPLATSPSPSMSGEAAPTDLGRFLEIVTVSGSVRYAGPYARTPTLKLSSVITADQMLEETNLDYAELTRLKDDGSYEYATFVPKDVLEGKYDLTLRARDSIRLVKKTVFGGTLAAVNVEKFSDLVQLTGQVARPEIYALKPSMKLSQVLTKDQILLDTNLNYAEILRLKADGKNDYVTFRPSEVLEGKWDFDLGARDVIRLVKVGYAPAAPDFDRFANAVQLSGPVQFAGLYAWRDGMKLSSLLTLAKPSLQTNQVYAEIVRPLGGSKFEYLTFAPREIAAGTFDTFLKARDVVKLYTTVPAAGTKQGAETPAEAPVELTAAISASAPAPTGTMATPPAPTAPQMPMPQTPMPQTEPSASARLNLGDSTPSDVSRFLEIVTISGSVRYVGPYARTPSLRLSSVVTADQILEETNLDYAELTRLRADGSYEYATFAPKDVLEGTYDMSLRARDSIRLVKKTVFGGTLVAANVEKFSDLVQLTGQVARPDIFALREGMRLSRLLTADQILLDTNLNYAEITRLKPDGKNEYITFKPSEVLGKTWDFNLGPRDVVRLVKVGYAPGKPDFDHFPNAVLLTGPVQFAGLFSWKEGMSLAEVQKLAKPVLETNQVYGQILRPLAGGKRQILTFAPREVESGIFDLILLPRDTIQYYSTSTPMVQIQAMGPVGQIAPPPAEATPAGATTGTAVPTATAVNVTAGPVANAQAAAGGEPGAPAVDLGFFLEIVNVSGVVRYAGPYARTPTLKLSSIVTKDQILQDTNLDYAELVRRKSDGSWEYKTFSPRKVLAGAYDLDLRAQDSIRFVKVGYLPEKPDFDHFSNAYAIAGEARYTGLFSIESPVLLSEILGPEQVIRNTDLYFAEIERWVTGGRTEYRTFSPLAVLYGLQDERIFPRDIIRLVPAGDKGENHDFSRFPDTVLMKGLVRYPGRYAWYEGMTLSTVLMADDLLIDTDNSYAEVRRRTVDKESILSFSPSDVVRGKTDISLQPRDIVIFYPQFTNRPITVSGEVLQPKVIPYYDSMELAAVLRSVDLATDLASLKAVITRASGEVTDIYLEDYLKRQSAAKFTLKPGDAVSLKRLLPDENMAIVTVRGAVKNPESIEFSGGMRLADALTAAGGYDERAYPKGIILIRKTAAESQRKQVDRLIAQLEAATAAGAAMPRSTDTTLSSAAAVVANMQIDLAMQQAKLGGLKQMYKDSFGRISIDVPDSLEALVSSPSNIVLERDDLIFVPTTPTYILVSGEVFDQSVVAFRDGINVRDAIAESGWLSSSADTQRIYIVRASGKLDSTEGKGFLFFKPNILNYGLYPGDTVIVPSKLAKISVGWGLTKDIIDSLYKIVYSVTSTATLLGL